jgi:hypothetical protein
MLASRHRRDSPQLASLATYLWGTLPWADGTAEWLKLAEAFRAQEARCLGQGVEGHLRNGPAAGRPAL